MGSCSLETGLGQMNVSWFVPWWQDLGGDAGCDPLVTVFCQAPSAACGTCLFSFDPDYAGTFFCARKKCAGTEQHLLLNCFVFSQLPWAKVLFKFRMLFLSSSSCAAAKNKELRRISPVWMPGAEEAVRWRLGVGESKHYREKNGGKGAELDPKSTVHKLRGKTADSFSPTNN